VAVADYTFVESGPNFLRYEVQCGRCGEAYCEVHTPVTPDFTAAVGALAIRAPDIAVPAAPTHPAKARIAEAMRNGLDVAARVWAWIR
jgi:hypothetical protein